MGESSLPLPLTPQRRRCLVAVMLRGDLAAYDATPLFQVKVDRMVDELLYSFGQRSSPADWDTLADRVIARYTHRLPDPQTSRPLGIEPAREATLRTSHSTCSLN